MRVRAQSGRWYVGAAGVLALLAATAQGQIFTGNVARGGRVFVSSTNGQANNGADKLIDNQVNAASQWISNGAAAPAGNCGGNGETITWLADNDLPVSQIQLLGVTGTGVTYQVLLYNSAGTLVFTAPNNATPCGAAGSFQAVAAGQVSVTPLVSDGSGNLVPPNVSRIIINMSSTSAIGVQELKVLSTRPGATPPLGARPDDPVVRDDELFWFMGSQNNPSSAAARIGAFQPRSTTANAQARSFASGPWSDWNVGSADAGRILGAPAEQVAVWRTGLVSVNYVEVIDNFAKNVGPLTRARYQFSRTAGNTDV